MTTTEILVELADGVDNRERFFFTCAYPLSALLKVMEANAIDYSLSSGSVCEITVPMPYGQTSVASTIGLAGSQCTSRFLSTSICFSCSNALAHSTGQCQGVSLHRSLFNGAQTDANAGMNLP